MTPGPTLALEPRTVDANGVAFAYVELGPRDGPLALCLHGFPDHAHTWMFLLPVLAEAGFHAVAPWMRGYHPTAPAPGGFYHPGSLGADANALHARLGGDGDAVLVGHDWGAVAAYSAAAADPHRWRRVVTVAVPPVPAWLPAALADPGQLRRSWYIGFFQLPWWPERSLLADDLARIHHLWEATWPPYREHPGFRAALHATLSAPGTIDAALAYYRSLLRPTRWSRRYLRHDLALLRVPPQPLLYLHGAGDGAVGARYVEPTRRLLAPGSQAHVIEGARHWVHLDRPDLVGARVGDFLAR